MHRLHYDVDRASQTLRFDGGAVERTPEAIGGKLVCKFLCKHCIDNLGQIEAHWKNDARIRLAIDSLKEQLPALSAEMSEGLRCIAIGQGGRIQGKIRKGTFQVDSSRQPDGSIIRPLKDSAETIRTMLRRRGATPDEIANASSSFTKLSEGIRVRVADGIEVMKATIEAAVYPAIDPKPIDQLAILKIAYEYLALNFGRTIFHSWFDQFRSALQTKGLVPNGCSVKELRARGRKYQPFHGIAIKTTPTGLTVNIRFFGCLAYTVRFLGITTTASLRSYTHHLDSGQEDWAEI